MPIDLTRVGIASGITFTLSLFESFLDYLYHSKIFIWSWFFSTFRFFFSAYLPLGFELATELTYPLPENIVSSILVAMSQVISIVMTIALSDLNIRFGAFFSLLAQVGILAFGTFITIVTPNRRFRQEAFSQEGAFKDIKFQRVNQEEKQIENWALRTRAVKCFKILIYKRL